MPEPRFPVQGGSTPAPEVPPGWYADPWRVHSWRWWDGRTWTGYVYGTYEPPRQPPTPAPAVGAGPALKAGGIAALGMLSGVLLTVVVGVAYAVLGGNVHDANNPVLLVISEMSLWVGLGGSCVVASKAKGTGSLASDLGLRIGGWLDVPIGIVAGLAGLVTIVIVSSVLRAITPDLVGSNTAPLLSHKSTAALFVSSLIACLGAPFIEELYFRGLVQGALSSRVGVWAVPAQAAIFGVVHLDPSQGLGNIGIFMAIGALGCILGVLRYRLGRLAPGMIAHGLFNLITILGAVLA